MVLFEVKVVLLGLEHFNMVQMCMCELIRLKKGFVHVSAHFTSREVVYLLRESTEIVVKSCKVIFLLICQLPWYIGTALIAYDNIIRSEGIALIKELSAIRNKCKQKMSSHLFRQVR